jgi:very-short-patch-repair endonuclease
MQRQFKPRNTSRAKELRREASPAERRLWQHLARSQMQGFKFSRQIPIGPYFVDFVCRSEKLVIELDGFSHDMRADYDIARTRYIEKQGFRVIRFTNEDVFKNLEGVLVMIGQNLTQMSWPPPSPSRLREGN